MLDVVSAMDDPGLFGPWFSGSSWDGWRTILKAAFALPVTDAEREFFKGVADRAPPARRVRELWIVAGRRAGKDSISSLIVAYTAALFSGADRLRRGERALCLGLACDRDQAKIILGYSRSYFADIDPLKAMVTRQTSSGFELSNGVDVAIGTNSFRSVRGRPILCAVLDECAFYRDENSSNPDEEVYRALKPGMATLAPDAVLIAISTPYRRAGLLYKKYRDHFGKEGDVLVIKAPSTTLNPTLDQAIIDGAMADDPAAASAEWMAEFRSDIESFINREVVDAAVVPGRHELPRVAGVAYFGFADAAGGSGGDSFTAAVAHEDRAIKRIVLDAVRERQPPFSPEATIAELSSFFKAYGLHKIVADRWGGEFPVEQFRKHGITCQVSERTKSDIYKELLPALNSGKVELLDNQRLIAQLTSLERKTARGGRDAIDHPPGAHDDVCNAAAGALVRATSVVPVVKISKEALRRAHRPGRRTFPDLIIERRY